MSMVDEQRVRRAHERLNEHEDVHEAFDRRISKNENYRLQLQGALKAVAMILGSGVLAWLADMAGLV